MTTVPAVALRLTASLWLAGATVAAADPALAAGATDLRPVATVRLAEGDVGGTRGGQACIGWATGQGRQAIAAGAADRIAAR